MFRRISGRVSAIFRELRTEANPAAANGRTLLVCAHANGFCKETLVPVINRLEKEVVARGGFVGKIDVLLVDLPGHGDSDKFSVPVEMETLAGGILEALDRYLEDRSAQDDTSCALPSKEKYCRIVGFGHSIGGTSLLTAELLRPDTFSSVFAVEPILVPYQNRYEDSPLAAMTTKRKSRFQNKEEAFKNYKGKGAFKLFTDECLRQFTEHGLKPDGQGGFMLKCDPSQEAEIYRVAMPVAFKLNEIASQVTMLNASHSKTHVAGEYALTKFRELKNPGKLIMLPATHFMVMECPDQIAVHLADHLTLAPRM